MNATAWVIKGVGGSRQGCFDNAVEVLLDVVTLIASKIRTNLEPKKKSEFGVGFNNGIDTASNSKN